jgi:hypothetical protein
MAENKKSVLLYCDIIHTVKELSDEEAGKLFKHYLAYINDLNPDAPDKLTQIVFEPIKQNLKRDLLKWKLISDKRSEAGKAAGIKSGEARRTKTNQNEPIVQFANDSNQVQQDKVKDKVKDIKNKVIKILFSESNLFDKNIFKSEFAEWNNLKLAYYYEAALAYSNEGNKYVNWKSAINNWAKRDELQGKLKFESKVIDPRNPKNLPIIY